MPERAAAGAGRLPKLQRLVRARGDAAPGDRAVGRAARAGRAVSEATLAQRAADVDPDALAFLMYTSGTTGFPKGAMHAHQMIRNVTERGFRLAITEQDAIMMYLPLFHLFAFSEGMLMSLVTGARQVLTEGFDPAESLELHRTRAGHDRARLRHPLQGAAARPTSASRTTVERAHRDLRRGHGRARSRSAAGRASCSARSCPATA